MSESYGLYHAPKVSTETFEQGLHNARRDSLAKFKFIPGTMHCDQSEFRNVPCVCGNPEHVYEARSEGWCNVAWDKPVQTR